MWDFESTDFKEIYNYISWLEILSMVPGIGNSRTYNLRTPVILAWMRIMERIFFFVQQFFMENPLQFLVLKKLRFWRSFPIYKVADIGTTFLTISSHRQHAGNPKFQHRGNIRCRIRWQWIFGNLKILPFDGIKSNFNQWGIY